MQCLRVLKAACTLRRGVFRPMDFAVHGVLVQPFVAAAHVVFRHAVQVGKKIMQAVHFGVKTVRLSGFQLRQTGFGFLVGVGVNHQYIAFGLPLPLDKGFVLPLHVAAVGFGKTFEIEAVHAVWAGQCGIVVDVDDFGMRVIA